jgi:hypothetical protein
MLESGFNNNISKLLMTCGRSAVWEIRRDTTDHFDVLLSPQKVGCGRSPDAMRKKQKRTAVDFLAMLSQITVPDDDSTESSVLPPVLPVDDSPDPGFDLPEFTRSGAAIDHESWFNGTDQQFGLPRPEFERFRSDFGLALSTSATIPESLSSFHNTLALGDLSAADDPLAPVIFDYRDFYHAGDFGPRIRKLTVLHVLNHIYKDIASRQSGADPGKRNCTFTPATVLVLCPYRHQAHQFITNILDCLPEVVDGESFEVEHMDRLQSEYSITELPKFLARTRPRIGSTSPVVIPTPISNCAFASSRRRFHCSRNSQNRKWSLPFH